jgi:ABC-2 type transport system permease protein
VIRTIGSEWIKLRTVTVHWVLVILAVAFPVVVSALTAAFGDFDFENELSREIAGLIVGTGVVTSMLLGAMAATSLTAEYGHNTIRPTFAATPKRAQVHAAKLVVIGMVVAVLAASAMALSWGVSQAILSSRDFTIDLADDGVVARLASLVGLAVAVSGFGYALGLLIRNAPATITILLLWPLIIENLINGLLSVAGAGGAAKWLPYTAAILATVDDGSGADALGRPMGLVYFAAVVVTLIVAGLAVDDRRDA